MNDSAGGSADEGAARGIQGPPERALAELRAENERLLAELEERRAVEQRLSAALEEALHDEAAARRAMLDAEARSRAKSTFLANMTHELRTPLNSILGFAQLMERDRALGDQHRENLLIIRKSGEHLLGLVNDILEMAKIEAGRLTLTEVDFDLQRLLTELEEMFAVEARRKGLQLVLERAQDAPGHVRADEGKLRQVLINLVSNALKFTQRGEVTVRVHRAGEAAPGGRAQLSFEVADTGPGLDPGEIDTLFQAFSQAGEGKQAKEGTGLGLAISREFARLMGGDIRVESEPGKGATFLLDMRVTLIEPPDGGAAAGPRAVVGLAPGQPAYRVLVADDRWESRHLVIKLLDAMGFEVRGATNGLGALAQWEAWAPHLILMDMRMPVMDGYEATRTIKASPKGKDTMIVAMTASAFEHNRSVALEAGCDDFLRKPFRSAEIAEMLERYLGARFVYEPPEGPPRGRPSDAPTGPRQAGPQAHRLTPADLVRAASELPTALRASLRRAATRLDARASQAAIDQIRATDPALAHALAEMVRGFRFDHVLDTLGPEEPEAP